MKLIPPRLVTEGDAFDRIGLVHRVRVPATPGSHRTVVMIHGLKGNENGMWVFARTLPEDWLLVSPRAIFSDPQGGYTWLAGAPDHWPPSLEMLDQAANAIARLVAALPATYAADSAQICLMGFSQGTTVAFASLLQHPGIVKGIAVLMGFMPAEVNPILIRNAFKNLVVFMAVGRRDPNIPLGRAQADAAALRAAGARLEYHEYDTGHKLTFRGLQDLEVWWRQNF